MKITISPKSNVSALTMSELVLVIVIVGIMVALGVPQYDNVLRNAQQKQARLNLDFIKNAQSTYFDENNSYYPSSGTVDLAAINTNLKLSITAHDLTYSCTAAVGDYSCQATDGAWTCTATKSTSPTCT